MVRDLSIEVLNQEGKAKHTRIEINKKRIDLPRKAAHVSREEMTEPSMFMDEFDVPMVSEFALQIYPRTLKRLMVDSSKHQSIKDRMRKVLSNIGDKTINIAYPLLINKRVPYEDESDFVPFEPPTEETMQKLYDLFDIEGFDILVLPVSSSNGEGLQWVKMATEVFTKRKPDFLNEFILSGMIRRNMPQRVALSAAEHYLKNGIESLTFDFESRKVPEARMKNIIDGIGEQWGKLHVHGTNVPHYIWHGTWQQSKLPIYDLLMSVYGFDSFGNLRTGRGGETPMPNKLKEKMLRKRFRVIETYGTYDFDGLNRLLQTETIHCDGPVCRATKPLDIYDKPTSVDSLDQLSAELKTHRLFSTHKEINQVSKMIDKDKYVDHMRTKREATNELASILQKLKESKAK